MDVGIGGRSLKKIGTVYKVKDMILGIDVGQLHLGVCVWDGKDIRQWALWESAGTWAKDVCGMLERSATDEFLQGVTGVVIERQPSKNPSMTRMMHYLEFFFASRGLPVTLQDAKRKLFYAATTPWFPREDATNNEWTYRFRKKLAVQTAANFVEQTNQPLRSVFEASKKKDDLADALFHAMAFSAGAAAATVCPPPAPKRFVARAPTDKQRRTGKLSASNVKYILQRADDVSETLKNDLAVARALKKHFGSLDNYASAVQNATV